MLPGSFKIKAGGQSMTQKALVMSVEGGIIKAMNFEKKECASCTGGCAKSKNIFEVSNPRNHAVKVGDQILIGATKKAQALQGLISLFFPFISSIMGYILAPSIMSVFGKTISSDGRAVFVLLFLFLSTAIVFVVTRKFPLPGKCEILEVL